jgi:hypothetical protein
VEPSCSHLKPGGRRGNACVRVFFFSPFYSIWCPSLRGGGGGGATHIQDESSFYLMLSGNTLKDIPRSVLHLPVILNLTS